MKPRISQPGRRARALLAACVLLSGCAAGAPVDAATAPVDDPNAARGITTAATVVSATDLPTTDLPTTDVPTTDVPTTELPITDLPTAAVPGTHGAATGAADTAPLVHREYPWHTDIVATTFWVGEVFDPDAEDGSQVYSTYDGAWMAHYGGCDGVIVEGVCQTEPRTAENGWFPTRMTPLENPFYLDVPFDDLNDEQGFATRGTVVPWAGDPGYAERVTDPDASLMKNRWVQLRKGDRECYGQVQDAGPGEYHDAAYVFGSDDARPVNTRYGGAGMDVSPALNGCLGFAELNGDSDRVDWRFVEEGDVPDGPWRRLITTSGVFWE